MSQTTWRAGLSSVVCVSGSQQISDVESESWVCSSDATSFVDLVTPHRVNSWPATCVLIVAEIVGTGVLALGGACAQLGVPLMLTVLVVGLVGNIFTSQLLGRAARDLPSIVTLGDAVTHVYGAGWGRVGYTLTYVFAFVALINYMRVLSDAVITLFYSWHMSRLTSTAIGCLIVLPTNQLRTLSNLTVLGAISFISLALTLAICLWIMMAPGAEEANCSGTISVGGFLNMNAAVSMVVFSYAGQGILLEMRAEMKNPADFPKAVNTSFGFLFWIYAVVAVVSYHSCGARMPDELLLVLPDGSLKAVTGFLMILHLMVSYTIYQQVLTRATCLYFVPTAVTDEPYAQLSWFGVSTCWMLLAFAIANIVPLFSDIVSIAGAAVASQPAFIMPSLLFLGLWSFGWLEKGPGLESKMLLMPCAICLFFGIWSTVVGTICSVFVMIDHVKQMSAGNFTE